MAPRPRKPRRCGCLPDDASICFKPVHRPMHLLEKVRLEADELEAAYLCDGEGMTQEEAGKLMGVSRGTVQRLVSSARKKVFMALVEESALVIGAGDFHTPGHE